MSWKVVQGVAALVTVAGAAVWAANPTAGAGMVITGILAFAVSRFARS